MALRRAVLRRRLGLLLAVVLSLGACTINLSGATVLEMGEGQVVENFEFEALDPSDRTMTVFVTAPIGTEVAVRFSTPDGATLEVFQTPGDPLDAGCREEPVGFYDCTVELPSPQPGEPGTWTATVHKITFPAAEVHVSIAWDDASQ